nr:hypothetical protein [Tanacetum cinerariifolium]
MRRASKGYTGVDVTLFLTMLVQGIHGEGSTVPVESHHTPSGDPTISQPPLSSPSRVPTSPLDSPLPGDHTPGSDEGSLTLYELTVLCTTLSNKVESLETELKLTEQTYGAACTKLIKKMQLEFTLIVEEEGQFHDRLHLNHDGHPINHDDFFELVLLVFQCQLVLLDEEESQRIDKDAEMAHRLQEEIDAIERQRMAQVHQAA